MLDKRSGMWTTTLISCIFILAITGEQVDDPTGQQLNRESWTAGDNSDEPRLLYPDVLELVHEIPPAQKVDDEPDRTNIELIHHGQDDSGVEHLHKLAQTDAENHAEEVKKASNKTPLDTELDVDIPVLEADDITQEFHWEKYLNADLSESMIDELQADDLDKSDKADDTNSKSFMNVEMLRRSDRSIFNDEKPTAKPHVFMKNVRPPDMFEALETHAHLEDEEKFVSKLVFVDSHSHAHVVHQNKDYPKVDFQIHDEM